MTDGSSGRFAAAGLLALASVSLASFAQQPAVEVTGAWARATVPAQKTAAAYLDIRSRSNARLVGAMSSQAVTAELHHSVNESGVMRMLPVKAIELPAGQTVRLAPGGYHIMLTGLGARLQKGDSMPLTLKVQGGDGKVHEIAVKVEVREPTAGGGTGPHRH